jgi:mRNA interferase RelE/StbE
LAYNVRYKRSVEKDLAGLDKREARRVLDRIERELATQPDRFPTLKGEYEGLRKMRIGNYRVVYAVLGSDVLILRVGHRKDIYR